MFGNDILPGVSVSETYRSKGSIWQGAPEATFFKTVKVNGSEAEGVAIAAGTIMKQLTDGTYTPIAEADIISVVSSLPGVRLAIVADKTAKTGTTNDDENTPSSVLVGICGVVDKDKLFVGAKAFTELMETQGINLSLQLEAWGFMPVNVNQG